MKYIILSLVLLSSCADMSGDVVNERAEIIEKYSSMVGGTVTDCFSYDRWTTCKVTRPSGCEEVVTYGYYREPLQVISKTPECRRGK